MRLFLAIQPNETQLHHLQLAQRWLHAQADGRFLRPADLHLTLAFLGECEPEPVIALLKELPTYNALLQLQGAGAFCDLIWAGAAPDPGLLTLQTDLMQQLQSAGYLLEARSFIPHITLCRRYDGKPDFEVLSESLQSEPAAIKAVHLIQTAPEGYRSLFMRPV